jgi:hypothetical protein
MSGILTVIEASHFLLVDISKIDFRMNISEMFIGLEISNWISGLYFQARVDWHSLVRFIKAG